MKHEEEAGKQGSMKHEAGSCGGAASAPPPTKHPSTPSKPQRTVPAGRGTHGARLMQSSSSESLVPRTSMLRVGPLARAASASMSGTRSVQAARRSRT